MGPNWFHHICEKGETMNVRARSAYMTGLVNTNPNLSVPWFLLTSYLYYLHDMSLVTDNSFESMTRVMVEHWNNIAHRHKQLVTPDMLRAGTAFNLLEEDYPTITKSAAWALAREDRLIVFKYGRWRRNS